LISSKIQGTGKIFVSLLFFILLSFNSLALLDSSTSNSINENPTTGLDVRVIDYEDLKLNEGGELNVHVTNRTNGQTLTNTSTICELHLYKSDGLDVLNTPLDYDVANEAWNYTGSPNLFTEQGLYHFFVYCNTSSVGGFYTGNFQVTESGFANDYEQVLLLVFLLLAIILIYLAYQFINLDMAFASGMLFCIVGVYLFRYGYLGISNFISESLAIIILGIGCTILFKTAVEYMNEASK